MSGCIRVTPLKIRTGTEQQPCYDHEHRCMFVTLYKDCKIFKQTCLNWEKKQLTKTNDKDSFSR